MIRESYEAVPEDRWFVKKTVNRLPPKNTRIISLPELGAFLLVFTVCIAVIALQLRTALATGQLPPEPSLLTCALTILLCSTVYTGGMVLRRCLN